MTIHTPPPNSSGTDKKNEKLESASELLDIDNNLKHTIFKNYFETLRSSVAGTALIRSLGPNIYSGLTTPQQDALSDGYFRYISKSYQNIGILADADKTLVMDAFFGAAAKYGEDLKSLLAQEVSIIGRQEKTLKQRVQSYYSLVAPNMIAADIDNNISSLSAKEINTAIYSPSRLTNLINLWHKNHTGSTDDLEFIDRKVAQIEAIALAAGLSSSDSDIVRITDLLESESVVPLDDLTKALGDIDALTIDQKRSIFTILRPTISLKEYFHLLKEGRLAGTIAGTTQNDSAVIMQMIQDAGIAGVVVGSPQHKAIYNRIRERIESNSGYIYISSESIFADHGGATSPAVSSLFDDLITKSIGTTTEEDQRNALLEDYNERVLNSKSDDPNKNTASLEEELNELGARGEAAEGYSNQAIAKRLSEYGVTHSEKWNDLSSISTPDNAIFLLYRSGGYDRYIEVRAYNPVLKTVTFINHTDTRGEYVRNESEQTSPVDGLLNGVKDAATITKESSPNFSRLEIGKNGAKGKIFGKSEWSDLISNNIIKEGILDGDIDMAELERRLKDIDNMNAAITKGLLIRTSGQAEDGSNSGDMFIEVTNVDDNAKNIEINTVIDSTGKQELLTLTFSEFLLAFNRTNCIRMGKAGSGAELVELCKTTKKPADFKNISYDSAHKALRFKNSADNKDFEIGSFRTSGITGDTPDHLIIDSIDGETITYTYIEKGEVEKGEDNIERLTRDSKKVKSVRKYKNVSLKFFADQLNHQNDGGWFAQEANEATTKHAKKHKDHHDEHEKHKDHPPHYHGGPLQWLAHSKNIGHLFKGIGMAFGELKHFIEHGDEHVAKEMEYAFITWMKNKGGVIGSFMPEEIYLDMKAEMESKKLKNINEFKDKWGGLSTGDCGKMAIALLNDKHTTNEQMFGIIFGIHKKVGTLYGIPSVQKEQEKTHIAGYPAPFPLFLYKLCVINGDDPKSTIEDVLKQCQKGGKGAYEGGIKPIPEMHMIAVYSQIYLQKKQDPPPVPGSFHAKIHSAWRQGEQEQKKGANEGEANMYATTDQIEKRMYMLAADGEVAQAIGFYERLIPRGAPMNNLMGLPFAIATTGLRSHMSTQLIRELHINGVYEQGFASSIFTALESQEKHENFTAMLKKLAADQYIVNGQPILTDAERRDLGAIFDESDPSGWDKDKVKESAHLAKKVEKSKIFWARHGTKLTRLMNVTDEKLGLLQLAEKIPEVKTHLNNTQERTDNRSFEAKLPAHKNGHYDIDSGSYTVLNPAEAANSFQAIDVHTGKFRQDDASQMHQYIFMSFRDAFRRVKGIEDDILRRDKFFEMFYQIIKKVTEKFGNDILKQLKSGENLPDWYQMLQNTVGFDIKNWSESGEVNRYDNSRDANFRKKAEREYSAFLGSGSGTSSIAAGVGNRTRSVIGGNQFG